VMLWRVHWTGSVLSADAPGDGLWDADELSRREAAARVKPGSPFMTSPNGGADPFMTAYFNSGSFRRLAQSSQRSYTDDYRTFFNFLWLRKKRWLETTAQDFEDYEDWRRRAPENPRLISGAKWVRECAALKRLYEWAQRENLIEATPIRATVSRGRDGSMVEVVDGAAHDVRTFNVKWLTPRMWKLWRDVGLLGLTRDGTPDETFHGRNGDRNAAFADLLFESGLRRTEAASLLTLEIPVSDGRSRYQWSRVANAAAKYRSGRPFPVSSPTVGRLRAYQVTARADAVTAAQKSGRYNSIPDKWIVTKIERTGGETTLYWTEEQSGRTRHMPLDQLRVDERRRLFRKTDDGLEPLWFWLGEGGLPFESHSWEQVFSAATKRCRKILGVGAPYCTPHSARHSFALIMLVAAEHAMKSRFGLSTRERRDYEVLYGSPWRMVKDLLGHQSEETTRNVYLAPVRDVQVRTLLEGDLQESAELLQALALASGRVQDVVHV